MYTNPIMIWYGMYNTNPTMVQTWRKYEIGTFARVKIHNKKKIGAKNHKILISTKKKTYSIKNSPLYLENGCKFFFHDLEQF
jgi:hypothetical protein